MKILGSSLKPRIPGLVLGGACFLVISAVRAADYFVYGGAVHGISPAFPSGEGVIVLYQAIVVGISGVAMIWVGMRKANSRASSDRDRKIRSESNLPPLA